MNFKFFQKPKPPGNMYLGFNMDDALINVLRLKQYHNVEIIGSDVDMDQVGVPISNCWLRILNWRHHTNPIDGNDMIEIDYRIIEINTTPINFTFRMDTTSFLRRIELSTIHINGL
jgi:hypothetical protein